MTIRYLTLAAGVAVVLATGVLHGVHTDRWKDGTDLDQAAERMKAVPLEFGDWQGQELTMEDDLRRAGIRGHLFRTYRHARTGKTVNLLLLMGRSGPISVHTPDVCYASAGYAGVGSPQKASVQAGPKPLPHWFLRVRKQNTEIPSELDVRWSWFNGERWDASDAPRFAFAKNSCLYKLYLLRSHVPGQKEDKSDPLPLFLEEFLPILDRTLLTDYSPPTR
jgi:hypothetical protein